MKGFIAVTVGKGKEQKDWCINVGQIITVQRESSGCIIMLPDDINANCNEDYSYVVEMIEYAIREDDK